MATQRALSIRLTALMVLALLAYPAAGAEEDQTQREKLLALNNLTGSDAMAGQLKAMLADSDGTKKLLEAALQMTKAKEQPFNYNAAYVLGRAAQELKHVDTCEVFYKICTEEATKLRSGQKLAESFGGLIDLYFENKKFDKTEKLCREFLELKGDDTVNRLKPAVMERMIQSMTKQNKIEEALKLVDTLVKAEEADKGWWSLQLKAWVLREGNRHEDAAKTYEQVLERLEQEKTLKPEQKARYVERNRYILSGVYVDMNKIDKAAEQLQILLKEKPDDPTYNNDLGYIWADHDMNLAESEKLVRKALEEDRKRRKADKDLRPEDDKDNAAYLDSMGWVLYKQKKYKEARKYLEDAIKDPEGRHIEIYDHLGDVLKALGMKTEAADAWKKGVEVAGTSKREQKKKEEVEKKLKDN